MATPHTHTRDEITAVGNPDTIQPAKEHDMFQHDEELAVDEKMKAAPGAGNDGDIGAKWLAEYTGERRELTDEDSESVRRTVDKYLLPVCFYIYFCQQLDKSSISFGAVFGLKEDANLHGSEYSWLSSVVYFAQLIFQPLSVWALVKFPVNWWICACFLGWGATTAICAAFTSFAPLLVFRFLLGACEASISPSMLIIVSMWWTRREQPLRNNIWYSANGIALILGSLLAYGLAHIKNTALYTYQWIFLVSGLIAIVLVIPTIFILPSHPTKAKFLSEEKKYFALERIRLNNTGTQNTEFKWSQVRECFTDPKTYGWMLMVFCISVVSGGISAFGPLILSGFGLIQFQTILYNMIPGGIGIVANIITAYAVTVSSYKAPVLLGVLLFPLAGAAAMFALPRGEEYRQSLLAVYFILQVYQCITPVVFSWAFANTAGHTKKTATTGCLYIGLTVGNIVGPQLYLSDEKPYYHTGLTGNLVFLCILAGTVVLQAVYLTYLNKRNERRRKAAGKTGKAIDYSLVHSSKWAEMRAKDAAARAALGHVEDSTPQNANAFADLTDVKNDEFIYCL